MYELDLNEKLSDIPDQAEFSPVPDGDYSCLISDAVPTKTKTGTGTYLKVKYLIEQGEQKGRYIFQNINFKNDSVKAEQIGKSQLKQLTIACGLAEFPKSSDQFIARPVVVKVGKDKNGQSEVKKISSILSAPTTAPKEAW